MGAEGPKNVKLATEIADGWLPMFIPPSRMDLYEDSLRGAKPDFDIASTCTVILGDDVEKALLPIKMSLSFYLGGMGAKEKNFHLELMERMGYGEAAHRVQDLFLAGKRGEAVAAVPERAGRRDRAGRPPRAHPRPARDLEGEPGEDAAARHAGPEGPAPDGGAAARALRESLTISQGRSASVSTPRAGYGPGLGAS